MRILITKSLFIPNNNYYLQTFESVLTLLDFINIIIEKLKKHNYSYGVIIELSIVHPHNIYDSSIIESIINDVFDDF